MKIIIQSEVTPGELLLNLLVDGGISLTKTIDQRGDVVNLSASDLELVAEKFIEKIKASRPSKRQPYQTK